jgi:hypothetical protein
MIAIVLYVVLERRPLTPTLSPKGARESEVR